MPAIRIQPFAGSIPKLSASNLPDSASQNAEGVKLTSGELRSWQGTTKQVGAYDNIVASCKSLHRLYGTNDKRWLSWAADVDVVGSALADSTDFRIYYTGESTPRKTNWALAISGSGPYPYDYLEMGVPAPTGAPTLTPTSGTGTTETRVYLNTFISTFGSVKEESAPSPVATTSLAPVGGSVLLNGFASPPGGKYNITHRRIYRTLLGTSDYGFVAEIPIATSSYTDSAALASTAIFLQSMYWTPPPSGLKGIVAMPNGINAGFVDNQIWFSEPYYPHAYPSKYMMTVDYPVVGLGVFGSSLAVMTERIPYIITGSHPASMSQESIQMPEPCISKRSIVTDQMGVMYVSPNGIVGLGQGQHGLVSEFAYTRNEWQQENPGYRFGKLYGRLYMLFDLSKTASSRTSIVFPREANDGITSMAFPAIAMHVDRKTGELFAASELDDKLYQLDSDATNYMPYSWKSKRYYIPQPVNYSCFQIDADYAFMGDAVALQAARNAIYDYNQGLDMTLGSTGVLNKRQINTLQINGSNMLDVPLNVDIRNISAAIIADGVTMYSGSVTGFDVIRLPAGFKSYNWEIILSGNTPIRRFAMATSVQELKQV